MASRRPCHVVMLLIGAAILVVNTPTATARAVNISSTWFLPEEGFPVFYRYFRDRITWVEADAVCQFHHANLVTVDTSVQYDATRAYLKELDIVNNVWIGLKRSDSTQDFTWTDYKTLNQDGGYWQEQIPKSASPLCAAADPATDFRWHSLSCGGPEVASFICEMPVPLWASEEDGCMLTSLPSLTVIFLPEQSAIELTSDCGQDGTRRIACKGQANREDMMNQLSCDQLGVSQEYKLGPLTPEVTSIGVGGTVSFGSSSSSATSISSTNAASSTFAGTTTSGSESTLSTASQSTTSTTSTRVPTLNKSTGKTPASSTGPSRTTMTTNEYTKASSWSDESPNPEENAVDSSASTSTIGTRGWTGHTNEAPTRHRRDADPVASSQMVSLTKSTPAVVEETTVQTTAGQMWSTETAPSTTLSTEMTTNGAQISEMSRPTSILEPEQSTENVTTGIQTLKQEPQSSTVGTGDKSTSTVTVGLTTKDFPREEDVFSEFKELDVVDITFQALEEITTTAPLTTVEVLLSTTEDFNRNNTDPVGTPAPTAVEVLTSDSGISDVNIKNVTDEALLSTTEMVSLSSSTMQTTVNTNDNTDGPATTTESEEMSNLSIQAKGAKSREEDEEERLKEEERKEEEKRFKEEEENRRRLFLPSPLRSLAIVNDVTSKAPGLTPLVEDAYEEPTDAVEPEPEVPSRPNRGRRLTRPQTHSFYPYFLNRVLG